MLVLASLFLGFATSDALSEFVVEWLHLTPIRPCSDVTIWGCIVMMLVASCTPSPFFAPCDDMLTMLICATRWLYIHLCMLTYMSMHESCLLVCRPYFNTMKLWISNRNLHLSLVDTIFCLLSCLFVCYLLCLFARLLVSVLAISTLLVHFVSSCYYLCIFLPLLVCWFSCLCLCMYTHGAMTHGARARSFRHKQKGLGDLFVLPCLLHVNQIN